MVGAIKRAAKKIRRTETQTRLTGSLFLGISGRASLLNQALLHLTARENEVIILAITAPRSGRHILNIDKLPIGNVGRLETEVIAHRR